MAVPPTPAADHEILKIVMQSLPAIIVAVGAFVINVMARQDIKKVKDVVDVVEKNTNSINQALQAKVDAGQVKALDQERIIAAQMQAPPTASEPLPVVISDIDSAAAKKLADLAKESI